MSLKHPSDKPDAARPESVEPVTLSDRVNAVINPTADPSPDAASQANGLTDELAHESADDAGETDDTGKAAGANAQSSETIGIFGARKDTFSARYHLTRRGKLRRLAQIAQIANKFDVVHGLTPVKMRLMLEALGPTFVKVGQILSMRSEILPQSFCDELSKLRADADPMPYSTVLQVLEDEYGRPVDEIFDHIDPTPLGSASLAQVHRAKLLTGEDVAIKVQRPGVRETMAQDVSIMRTIAGIATKTMRSAQVVDLSGVVEELWDTFESETDFLIETRNLAEFKRFCERYKYMDCPKPYPELCTEHVVVMDYVEGISVSHPDELLAAGYDLKEIGTKLVDNYATQVLDEGFFHADPHPGNIMVRGGQIVLLDLGMTGRLNAKTRSVLKDMIFAVAEQDSPKLADGLLRFAGAALSKAGFLDFLIDGCHDLAHSIFCNCHLFSVKILSGNKRKSNCTLSGMVGNGVRNQSHLTFPGNLLHDLCLADSRGANKKNRALGHNRDLILPVFIFQKVGFYCIAYFFLRSLDVHNIIFSSSLQIGSNLHILLYRKFDTERLFKQTPGPLHQGSA